MSGTWKSFLVGADEGVWEPASYNIRADDGQNTGAGGGCCANIRMVSR